MSHDQIFTWGSLVDRSIPLAMREKEIIFTEQSFRHQRDSLGGKCCEVDQLRLYGQYGREGDVNRVCALVLPVEQSLRILCGHGVGLSVSGTRSFRLKTAKRNWTRKRARVPGEQRANASPASFLLHTHFSNYHRSMIVIINISWYSNEIFVSIETFRILYETQWNFIGWRVNFVVKRSLKSRRTFFVSVYSRIRNTPLIVIPYFTLPKEITNSLQRRACSCALLLPWNPIGGTVYIAGDTPSLPFREGRLMASV